MQAQIFNAWCEPARDDDYFRRPPVQWMLICAGRGSDWIHTSKDQGALIRDYTKWDDQPASAAGGGRVGAARQSITRTAPRGPVYICLDAGLQESALTDEIIIPDASRFAPARRRRFRPASIRQALKAIAQAKFPLILAGRVSRDQGDWDRRVRFAEAIGAAVLTSSNDPSAFPTTHRSILPPLRAPEQGGDSFDRKGRFDHQFRLARSRRCTAFELGQGADARTGGENDYSLHSG